MIEADKDSEEERFFEELEKIMDENPKLFEAFRKEFYE
jgi:hypothetical protein